MLQLDGVHVRLGDHLALADINLSIPSGEFIGILGANGAGKSTLLAVLAGDLVPDQGQVLLDGHDLSACPATELARRRAVLPQHLAFDFDLAVAEIVAMGAYPWPELTPEQLATLISDCLSMTDALPLQQRRFPSLSGGEALRVQLARLLLQIRASQNPAACYLLLDEPTANLDPRHQAQILAVAQTQAHQGNTAVIATLHDVNLASRWCDRLILLRSGKIIVDGHPSAVLTPENLAAIYGIQAHCMPHPTAPDRPLVLFA